MKKILFLLVLGADIVTVKEFLGHKMITMTRWYAHLNQEHKKKVVGNLDGHQGGFQGKVDHCNSLMGNAFLSGGIGRRKGLKIQ